MFSEHIFRSYDVRGVYGIDLTEEVMQKIGNAFAQMQGPVAAARDSRLSGKALLDSFVKGASAAAEVVNLGEVPSSAALRFSTCNGLPLAYVTASHLSREWNGVKMFEPDGHGFAEEKNVKIKETVMEGKFSASGGSVRNADEKAIIDDYVKNLASGMSSLSQGMKILVDCGNGVAGFVARKAFNACGFEADVIFEEPGGSFPNRKSDPVSDPLSRLSSGMRDYDVGIAYDGDADRLVMVSKDCKLTAEQASYVILSELLKVHEGPIVANIECSSLMELIARKFSVDMHYSRVGHTFVSNAVKKHGAVFGVESSGHYFVPSLAKYSDAIATSVYACYAIQKSGRSLSNIVNDLPKYPSEKKAYDCPDAKKFGVIRDLERDFREKYGSVNSIDGVRVDTEAGFVLVRASNTEPKIRVTMEGKSQKQLDELREEFTESIERKISA